MQGLLEPLITEKLFYEVQDVLDENKRKSRAHTKSKPTEKFHLRGFLICPKCNRVLTGSGSKGRNRVHYYYHCIGSCGCRFGADLVNPSLKDELKRFVMKPAVVPLFRRVIKDVYSNQSGNNGHEIKHLSAEIKKTQERLAKA